MEEEEEDESTSRQVAVTIVPNPLDDEGPEIRAYRRRMDYLREINDDSND